MPDTICFCPIVQPRTPDKKLDFEVIIGTKAELSPEAVLISSFFCSGSHYNSCVTISINVFFI